ncbi:MAG TPA: hypothetical protein VI911_09410 [Patescibacteria group bacterium]|nr:MAG: hypothetical protein UR43_C0005G0136 [candidate division TM6 bacterium GW2011_GWF2_33_332]HLD91215.1 hypothetical protein [Patescibacteria group bacterium]
MRYIIVFIIFIILISLDTSQSNLKNQSCYLGYVVKLEKQEKKYILNIKLNNEIQVLTINENSDVKFIDLLQNVTGKNVLIGIKYMYTNNEYSDKLENVKIIRSKI